MSKSFMPILSLVFVMAIFYAVVLIPEKKRKNKYKSMLNDLKVNDEVVTRGGVVGKIERIHDDFIVISTGPDKVKVKITKNGVGIVINKEESK
ncbi:preprotein translocase subunit YajC [Clostridium botulinum]|uniref:Preprotein translocase subunit YajC n=1 Tax=Clostridium botulinum TaxID=1491 RepID=A0A9Q1V199_CLOBO|nr:preprotein translocase subunit YajC [Clostridium botulinum]AEB75737.1 preprotein translocase, YajC subunit [Clostridium botulinum BKT015925]KEH99493.1 preprotein translocase subunit YajC [Clostridium botulinum D str. 16868]KEI00494.1 preprotein translocase subunit YajC [Clostridium botulinum C/D str. Sp77]KLU75313.1 preprotein translocase subunit YajC [Clostridium botulinum V891]KOA74466.1 preprotein translocase subunit YajC [Clostridium botulinum]